VRAPITAPYPSQLPFHDTTSPRRSPASSAMTARHADADSTRAPALGTGEAHRELVLPGAPLMVLLVSQRSAGRLPVSPASSPSPREHDDLPAAGAERIVGDAHGGRRRRALSGTYGCGMDGLPAARAAPERRGCSAASPRGPCGPARGAHEQLSPKANASTSLPPPTSRVTAHRSPRMASAQTPGSALPGLGRSGSRTCTHADVSRPRPRGRAETIGSGRPASATASERHPAPPAKVARHAAGLVAPGELRSTPSS
jgi:hypothetical protein